MQQYTGGETMGELFDLIMSERPADHNKALTPFHANPDGGFAMRPWSPPQRGIVKGLGNWWNGRQESRMDRQAGRLLRQAAPEIKEAAAQHSHVTDIMDGMGAYGQQQDSQGIREVTGLTFEMLRAMAQVCVPVRVINEVYIQQCMRYFTPAVSKRGRSDKPCLRVCLRRSEAQATDADREAIHDIESFIFEGGFCNPPETDRPENWQPGGHHQMQQFLRDSMELDWAAMRVWPAANPRARDRWPAVSWSAVDSGLIRRIDPRFVAMKNGLPVFQERPNPRPDTDGNPIRFGRLDSGTSMVSELYTAREMMVRIRNARSDTRALGFGYPELESLTKVVTSWLNTLHFNASRFDKNSLPRGAFVVMGNMPRPALARWRLEWKQTMSGQAPWFNIPLLNINGNRDTPTDVKWLPLDMSPHDMEQSQFAFFLTVLIHCTYLIHPEQTGFAAVSPFRPPLSEASPEVRIQSSTSIGLEPKLIWMCQVLNDLIHMNPSWRRYMIEAEGIGDWNEADDVATAAARLQTGLSTPRRELARRDEPVPEAMRDHPAMDMLMPIAQGMAYVDQQKAQAQQQAMMQQQMAAQQAGGPGAAGPGGPGGPGGQGGEGLPPGMGQRAGGGQQGMPSQQPAAMLPPGSSENGGGPQGNRTGGQMPENGALQKALDLSALPATPADDSFAVFDAFLQ